MSTLHFGSALLPSGWADDVQVVVTDGTITKVTTGVAAGTHDERHQLAISGIASLHSHAFQRGMAGLAERAATPRIRSGHGARRCIASRWR